MISRISTDDTNQNIAVTIYTQTISKQLKLDLGKKWFAFSRFNIGCFGLLERLKNV
ncbi:MAG: hypothetical protein U9N59_11340 [Campylobacterota bacterium]|nr:hypothetical protein [Campylobacterota bacterium]